MFSYYFPVTQLLVVWVDGGTLVSPQGSPTHGSVDPNSWILQPKTPIGGCNCFLKGTKTRDPPVWNPPPPIDANEFVLFLPMKVSFFVSLWGYDLEVMTLCIYIIDFAFSHPPSTIYVLPQGLFRSCGWAALMWTRDWEMLKKKVTLKVQGTAVWWLW